MSSDACLGQHENLTYWSAKECVIGLATPLSWLYVCHIRFHRKDGSILVQWPYFRDRSGVATVVRLEADGSSRRTIRFIDEGKVTSHLVKYSHHPDGHVHFSQDGKVRTEIRRAADFPLDGPIGKLFELHAFRPAAGFLPLNRANMKKGRPHLLFNYSNSIPIAVKITGTWRRKVEIANWSRPARSRLGPRAQLHSVATGMSVSAFFVGQADSYPLQDHLLVVSCETVKAPTGIEDATLLFLCGADADEVARPGDPAPPSEYLAAMYPVQDREGLERVIGTIDYTPSVKEFVTDAGGQR